MVNQQNEEQLLQDTVFVNTVQVQDINNIIKEAQMRQMQVIKELQDKNVLEWKEGLWYQQNRIIVVGNNNLK